MIDTAPVIEAVLALIIAMLMYLTNLYRKKAEEIAKFYDPDTAHEVPEKIIETLHPKTWKMSDSVKEFACIDLSDTDKEKFHKRVKEAEDAYAVRYQINLSDRVYLVEYGQIVGMILKEG